MADKEFQYDKTFEDNYWVDENGQYKGVSYTRNPYTVEEGSAVHDALKNLSVIETTKPAEWTGAYTNAIDNILADIGNRGKFSYDVNGDALYQQYKDKYIQQGKLAMQDTMGQAAAMTGGYGNSYAAAVGNQAYQSHLNNLNDIVPELYQMAYDRYNQETQDLYNRYSLLSDRENTLYGRHRDTVSDWQADRNYYADRYNSERAFDYGVYSDTETANQTQFNADRTLAYSQYIDDYNKAYNEHRDSVADDQWQATYDAAHAELDAKMKTEGYVKDEQTGKYVIDEGVNDTPVDAFAEADARYGKKLAGYTTKKGQAEYLASLGLNEDVAFALLDKYGVTELTDRTWEMVDDGGINWFGLGIDADAKVSDGTKTYTLAELRKELKKTMSNKEANAWIKGLEDRLGI